VVVGSTLGPDRCPGQRPSGRLPGPPVPSAPGPHRPNGPYDGRGGPFGPCAATPPGRNDLASWSGSPRTSAGTGSADRFRGRGGGRCYEEPL